jgi:hypothetical protein
MDPRKVEFCAMSALIEASSVGIPVASVSSTAPLEPSWRFVSLLTIGGSQSATQRSRRRRKISSAEGGEGSHRLNISSLFSISAASNGSG